MTFPDDHRIKEVGAGIYRTNFPSGPPRQGEGVTFPSDWSDHFSAVLDVPRRPGQSSPRTTHSPHHAPKERP